MGDKLAHWLYETLENMSKRPDIILYNSKVRQDIQTLEPAGNTQKRQKEYVLKKFSLCILILIAGVFLSVIMWIKSINSTEIVDNLVKRNSYGEGSSLVELVASQNDKSYDISLVVEEKSFTDEEITILLKEFEKELEKIILGENKGFDRIECDLALTDTIEGYPFSVMWITDENYIDSGGKLIQDTLDKPQETMLYATVEYYDESGDRISIEKSWKCTVYSKVLRPDASQIINKGVIAAENSDRTNEYVVLPSQIGDMQISWSYPKSHMALLFMFGTPLIILLIYFSMDRDLHQKVVEREQQMLMDYPEIVSSLALLIGAGMNVQNSWLKIVNDYRAKREETGKKRYAYEEMLFTVYEMENGVLQVNAYERFGRRCRISCYTRLSTMISQNLRKGSTNLAQLLTEEAKEAFENRKHMARKLGEKAGTKLLLPMMMILGVMMVIIMVPAFRSIL